MTTIIIIKSLRWHCSSLHTHTCTHIHAHTHTHTHTLSLSISITHKMHIVHIPVPGKCVISSLGICCAVLYAMKRYYHHCHCLIGHFHMYCSLLSGLGETHHALVTCDSKWMTVALQSIFEYPPKRCTFSTDWFMTWLSFWCRFCAHHTSMHLLWHVLSSYHVLSQLRDSSHCIFLTFISVHDVCMCLSVCVWERERVRERESATPPFELNSKQKTKMTANALREK